MPNSGSPLKAGRTTYQKRSRKGESHICHWLATAKLRGPGTGTRVVCGWLFSCLRLVPVLLRQLGLSYDPLRRLAEQWRLYDVMFSLFFPVCWPNLPVVLVCSSETVTSNVVISRKAGWASSSQECTTIVMDTYMVRYCQGSRRIIRVKGLWKRAGLANRHVRLQPPDTFDCRDGVKSRICFRANLTGISGINSSAYQALWWWVTRILWFDIVLQLI